MRKDEAVGRLCSVSDSCQSASTECRCDARTAGNRPHAATIPTSDSAVRESFTEPSTRAAMHNRGRCSFGIDDSGFSSAVSFGCSRLSSLTTVHAQVRAPPFIACGHRLVDSRFV